MEAPVEDACDISPEIAGRILALYASMSEQEGGIVLKCDQKKMQVVVDDEDDNISVEDISEDIPETSPRFVVLRYATNLDPVHKQYYTILVHFNPYDCNPSLKRLYASTIQKVMMLFETPVRQVEIASIDDFTRNFIDHKVFGGRGTVGSRLEPQESGDAFRTQSGVVMSDYYKVQKY